MSSPTDAKPRFIAGTVMPADTDRLPHPQPQPLLPPDIRKVSSALNISDYTHDGVNEAIEKRYWTCVDELMQQGAQSITLAGFPIASQLGRRRVLELQEKTAAKTGVVADSHAEATLAALAHLGTKRITIASRWADELNKRLTAYLTESGIEVLAVTSANQWGKQAFAMSIEEGVKTRVSARTRSDAARAQGRSAAARGRRLAQPGGGSHTRRGFRNSCRDQSDRTGVAAHPSRHRPAGGGMGTAARWEVKAITARIACWKLRGLPSHARLRRRRGGFVRISRRSLPTSSMRTGNPIVLRSGSRLEA